MNNFEVCRNKDGSFALFDLHTEEIIDGVLIPDEGQDPVKVAATANTELGQKFYVVLPVCRAMIEQEPQIAEERLKMFAEQFERTHTEKGCSTIWNSVQL